MAVKPKKKAPAAAKRPGSKKPEARAAEPKAKAGSKVWMVGLAFFLILAIVGGQIVYMSKKRAAQKLEFQRVAGLVEKGTSDGQCWGARAIALAKDGSFYHLDGEAPNARLQKFGPHNAFVKRYRPSSDPGVFVQPIYLATGADGMVYELEKNGRVLVFDEDLNFKRAISTGIQNASSMAVDKANEMLIVDGAQQRLAVVSQEGKLIRPIGDESYGKGALTTPLAVCVDEPQENIYVLEGPSGKARVKVYDASGVFQRAFFVEVKLSPYTTFGVDPSKRLYFSELEDASGIKVYDNKGNFIGASKSSQDEQMYPAQGYIAVSPWSGDVIVNYSSAVGRFRFAAK